MNMSGVGGTFLILYFCFLIGIAIFLLVLISRFVGAHERIASALERIAQNPPRENR
jgi:SNF family Na+-dependent transporter